MQQDFDHQNIIALNPTRRRTWAVYACESEENKHTAQELECWAVVERIRNCDPWERAEPALYIGSVPCMRETFICPLFLHAMEEYKIADTDLLGYSHNPVREAASWRANAERHFESCAKMAAKRAARLEVEQVQGAVQ